MPVEQHHSLARSAPARAVGTPDTLYLCCAVLLVSAVSFVHFIAPVNTVSYERNVWHRMAVIKELVKGPFDAGNPHVDAPGPSRGYMPWFVGLAILGKVLGLNALQIRRLSATLSATRLFGVFSRSSPFKRLAWTIFRPRCSLRNS